MIIAGKYIYRWKATTQLSKENEENGKQFRKIGQRFWW
jgi:hypothetical protein